MSDEEQPRHPPAPASTPASTPALRPYAVGMEIEAVPFTPPEVRPEPLEWEPYHGPRFTRRVRVAWTAGLLLIPALLLLLALSQVLLGDGRERAVAVIFLLPVVPFTPFLVRAMRDLWGVRR